MSIEAMMKKRDELIKELEEDPDRLAAQDDEVRRLQEGYLALQRNLQTRIEHRVIEEAEAELERAAAWRELVDARLRRIEETFVATSKMSAAAMELMGEMLGLVMEIATGTAELKL